MHSAWFAVAANGNIGIKVSSLPSLSFNRDFSEVLVE